MLITVQKITKTKVRDENGAPVKSPVDGVDEVTQNEVLPESIDVWDIRSIRDYPREFNSKYPEIKGEIAVIYLRATEKSRKPPEMHVHSNHLELAKEVNDLRSGTQKSS